jgi:hypothetical protein
VLVCIGVVDVNVDELETGVVDQAAPGGVLLFREGVDRVAGRRGGNSSVAPALPRSLIQVAPYAGSPAAINARRRLQALEAEVPT